MNIRFANTAIRLCVLTTLVFWTASAAAEDKAPEQTSPKQQVIVTVNGTPLTQADINAEIDEKLAGVADRMGPEQIQQIKERMRSKAVDNFITRTVLAQECKKHNITVSPAEIDEALNEMRASLPDDMTLEEALQAGGITLESIRSDISFGLKVNKLFESTFKETHEPTEEEIKKFFEQNRQTFEEQESVTARHILITASEDESEDSRAEKRTRAVGIREQLVKGGDFEKLAGEHSECPSKAQGGSLGSFTRGRMVKEFEDAAFTQKVDEIGPVVETMFGYHIIQVQERTPAGKRSYDDVKDQIKEHLTQTKTNENVRDYIEKLKSNATIVYGTE